MRTLLLSSGALLTAALLRPTFGSSTMRMKSGTWLAKYIILISMKYKSFLFFLKQLVMFVVCWGDVLLLLFMIIIMMMVCSIMIQLSIRSPFSRCKSDAKISPTHLSTRVPLFAELFANHQCKQVQRYHTYSQNYHTNFLLSVLWRTYISCYWNKKDVVL